MKEKYEKKQHFLQYKGKHSNNKEAYTDRSKSIGRKVDFAVVFADISRSSIHTCEMTAIKNSNEREKK